MDWKNIRISHDYIVDLAIYIGVAVVLILASKWLWDWREARRLRKEMAEYHQRKEEEAQELH